MGEGSGEWVRRWGRWRSEVVGEGVLGHGQGSEEAGDEASFVRAGVSGRAGEMSARVVEMSTRVGELSGRVARGVAGGWSLAHWLGEAGLMVVSETSRWWARERGRRMPRSEVEPWEGEGDGGSE